MESNTDLLKRAADDYCRLALKESGGFYHGCLVGLRTSATLTENSELEEYINTLLSELKKQQSE